jgi:predicted metal-dependent enzyme (double-stranded beta helix superfamily)
MSVTPHNHNMYAVIGLYTGREDNAFWRQKDGEIEIAGGKSIGVGDAETLGRDIIHSVLNPINKKTAAIHVYGGDLMSPLNDRMQWDAETLKPAPLDMDDVKHRFAEFGQRYDQWEKQA